MVNIYSVRLILIFLLTIIFGQGFPQSVTLPTSTVDVLHYVFQLSIHDYTDEIQGEADIFVSLPSNRAQSIILHLSDLDSSGTKGMMVDEILFNDKPMRFSHQNHTLSIQIPATPQNSTQGTFTIKYHGTPADGLIIGENQYGDRTFFGDNWPNRAHFWLPTHDHPSDKATCEFMITAPAHYQVVSNGRLVEESYLLPNNQTQDKYKLTHWAISQPIPTKVMVFGAARFAIQYPPQNQSTTIENWVYPEDREVGFQQFSPTADILLFYESILGAYPYKKIANIQSKTQYGGMENATAIFYNESVIVDQPSIEGLIAHEIAHQWFGNSISEKNWADVWLSEGFSTYMTHLYFEHVYGRDSMAARLIADKERIFSFHLQSPQSKIIDSDESNLFQLLNANTYQKGAWLLHMLRSTVGDEVFFNILRQFFNRYQHKNASTNDFITLASKLSGRNLSDFFSQWLYRPDYPVLESRWKYQGAGKKLKINIKQTQESEEYLFPLHIGIRYNDNSELEVQSVTVDQREMIFNLNVKSRVKEVVIDPNTWLLHDTPLTKN